MDRKRYNQRNSNRGRTLSTITNGISIRGSVDQIIEKLETLGREAELGKDLIAAENFFQAADHYKRVRTEGTNHVTE